MPVTIKTSAMKYKNPDTGQYEGVDMIEEKAVRDIVADDYSPTSPYAVDAYCLYNGDYYRCTTAIQSGEAWNASHWTPTQVSDELVSIKGAVDSIGTNEVANESNVSGATATAALNTLNGAINNCVTNVKYNNGYLQKTVNGTDSNIIQIQDTPTNESTKLPSSKSVYSLSERMAELGQLTSGVVDVPAGVTTTINVPNNTRALLIAFGSYGFLVSVNVTSSGGVSYQEYWKAPTISFSTGTRQFIVTNSTTANLICGWFDFLGKTIT